MKQTDADRLGQLSKDARHSLSVAGDALVEALDHMKLVVGDDGNDIEQSTEAPWPVSQLSFVSPMTAGSRARQTRANAILNLICSRLVADAEPEISNDHHQAFVA
jgi:hypothetical protein